jgi:hypothetical protein
MDTPRLVIYARDKRSLWAHPTPMTPVSQPHRVPPIPPVTLGMKQRRVHVAKSIPALMITLTLLQGLSSLLITTSMAFSIEKDYRVFTGFSF